MLRSSMKSRTLCWIPCFAALGCSSVDKSSALPVMREGFKDLGVLFQLGASTFACGIDPVRSAQVFSYGPGEDPLFRSDATFSMEGCPLDFGGSYTLTGDYHFSQSNDAGKYAMVLIASYDGCALEVSATYFTGTSGLADVKCASICGEPISRSELDSLGLPLAGMSAEQHGSLTSGGRKAPLSVDPATCVALE